MASVQVNLNEPASDQLKDLIARTSMTRHPVEDIRLGSPVRPPGGGLTDTSILVSLQNEYTSHDRLMTYRRADLSQAFGLLNMTVSTSSSEWYMEELITQLNSLGHTQLLHSQLRFTQPPPLPAPAAGETVAVQILARSDSVLYVGEFILNVTQNPGV